MPSPSPQLGKTGTQVLAPITEDSNTATNRSWQIPPCVLARRTAALVALLLQAATEELLRSGCCWPGRQELARTWLMRVGDGVGGPWQCHGDHHQQIICGAGWWALAASCCLYCSSTGAVTGWLVMAVQHNMRLLAASI